MALPHSRVLIHQPLGGAQGQATDIEIQAAEIIRIKKSLNEILASNTGQSIKKIEKRYRQRLYYDTGRSFRIRYD